MGWVVSATSRQLYPREGPGPHYMGAWLVSSPGFHPRTVQPVASRNTDWTIPAHKNPSSSEYISQTSYNRFMEFKSFSMEKPTRCTNVSNYFISFGMTLYMFRTVFPSIIRSSRLYIQQQPYVKQILLSASTQPYLFDICLLLYVQSWTPDDGRKDRPKHVECHSKIK